ncbi:hypothetical protein C2S51_014057 [Perilla frutescens var. frutescens]|nr:hypothetical protein C2S51_014057 [Perilla frutescens var. frutescens]
MEGFLYGHCKGVLMRCICYKDCKGASPKAKPPLTPPPPPRGCPKTSHPGGCPKPPVK